MGEVALNPVLLFDSGIGGLTILQQVRVLAPERSFIYVADDEAFPYGSWKEDELKTHIVLLMADLIETYRPDLIIIACNTASTLVLSTLRMAFPKVKFVGTVPAIKPAAERTSSKLISVLATPGTVKRAYTRDLIQSFARQCHVRLVGSEDLAELAESHMVGKEIDTKLLKPVIDQCLIEKDGKRTDIVVLACTHYPFLIDYFRQVARWPVDWLDPAQAITRHAMNLLNEHDHEPDRYNQIQERSGQIQERSGQKQERSGRDLALFTSGQISFSKTRLIRGFGLETI